MIQILNKLYNSLWLLEEDQWLSMEAVVAKWAEDEKIPTEMGSTTFAYTRDPISFDSNGIAQIDISGIMAPRLTGIERKCMSSTDYFELREELEEARTRARGVLYCVNSPGGIATGALAAFKDMETLAEEMPTVAHVQTQAASPAYMAISSSEKIYSESGASVGSIGAVATLVDVKKQLSLFGRKLIRVTSTGAENKILSRDGSISEKEEKRVQERLDEELAPILSLINRHRDIDMDELKGSSVPSDSAEQFGLIDGIHSSIEESKQVLIQMINES